MSDELQSLLDRINADGIQKAEAEAAKIIADAKAEAAKILADAKSESETICAKASSEAEAFQQRALSAAKHAARDITLQLRADLVSRLNAAVSASAASALTPDFMAQLVKELAGKFADSPDTELTVRSAVKDVALLENALKGALADSIKTAPVVIASPEISAGVQVEFNDSDCCFDFSEAAVTDLLAAYAGEQLAAVFKA